MLPGMDAATAEALLRVAEEARPRMRGFDGAAVIDDLERDYAAMVSALDWYLDTDQFDSAFRLASGLVPFWMATKRIDEGDRWFEKALSRAGDPRPARALYDHGYLVFWAGRYELAEDRFREARTLAAAGRDANLVALALAGSARVALNDDVDAAVRLLREAIEVTEGTTGSDGRSSAMHVLGVALQMSGDLDGARGVMSQRIEIGRETGDEFLIWVESANLSMVERQLGNLAEAEALSRDALRIVSDRGDQLAIPWVLNGLAAVTAAKGDHEQAATLLGMAEAMIERAGGEWPPDEREQYEGTLAVLSAALTPAALAQARDEGASMTVEQGVAYALADDRSRSP
jgi:tetratricopeptide (TPR) repeat protein